LIQLSASHNAQNAEVVSLPEKAPALWQTDRKKGESPPAFIRRHYSPWIPGITKADILRLDKHLYWSLNSWTQYHGKPEDLDLPTRAQVTNRWIERVQGSDSNVLPVDSVDQLRRFIDAVARRRKKARKEAPDLGS